MSAIVSAAEHHSSEQSGADRVGVIASVLCAIHCAATPFLLLFAPAFGKIWSHPASHWLVAIFVVPLALVMVIRGFRVHRKRWIIASGLIGVTLVIIGAIIPYWESYARERAASQDQAAAIEISSDGETTVATELAEDPVDSEMVDDGDVFVWTVGEPLPEAECETAETGQCLDACCPSLITDSEGNTKLHIPKASIVTTLGGVALICTHLGNLCACRRRRQTDCCHSPFC